jgi:hypothetical protein
MVEETEGASGVIFAYLVTAVGEQTLTQAGCCWNHARAGCL